MREYQQKKMKPYLLPETVYRQALWAVKDLPRLKAALDDAVYSEDSLPSVTFDKERVKEEQGKYMDVTGNSAVRAAMLSMRIDSIEGAFSAIPEKYRKGIKLKLTRGIAFSDAFHINTWKKWQQIYIFYVAKNLGLY